MLPEQRHIDYIKEAFQTMQSKEDLLNLLNYAKPIVYGEKAVPFQLKQLTWYSNPNLNKKRNTYQKLKEESGFGISRDSNKEDNFKIINMPSETLRLAVKRNPSRYIEFKIKKKSGEERNIHSPVKGLMALQKTLALILQCIFEPHKAAMGFVSGKSIVDNAKIHVGNNYVYNIDLKDFFPSIDQARVWKCLQLKPFNLIDSIELNLENAILTTGIKQFVTSENEYIFYKIQDKVLILINDKKGNLKKYEKRITGHLVEPEIKISSLGENLSKHIEYQNRINNLLFEDAKNYVLNEQNIESFKYSIHSRKRLAGIIASLCCTEMEVERKKESEPWQKIMRNVLPQGAPTSPVLTNIVCQRLDYLLSAVANRFGLKYSRYADDITFSSMHNVYQSDGDFLKELKRVIAEQNFHIKENKTRLQKSGYRQEVTGLLINDKVNVQKRYIKQLRMWLYYWERYGYKRAFHYFIRQYVADKGDKMKGKADMAKIISGKLDYLKMVKGGENELYLKFRKRFDKLNPQKISSLKNDNYLDIVLDRLLKNGLEDAMSYYGTSVKPK